MLRKFWKSVYCETSVRSKKFQRPCSIDFFRRHQTGFRSRHVFRMASCNVSEKQSSRSSLTVRVTHICIPKAAGIPARPAYTTVSFPLEKETVEKAALRAIKHLFPSAALARPPRTHYIAFSRERGILN